MNERPLDGRRRDRRIAGLVGALLALSARADAWHHESIISSLGPIATTLVIVLVAFLGAAVLVGGVVLIVVIRASRRPQR